MKKLSILLLVALLSFSFVACGDDDEVGGITFTNNAQSVLKLSNNDAVRLVAFKGMPSSTTLLGGVEAQTTTGMSVTPDGQLSVVYCVRYDDYLKQGVNAPIVSSAMVFLDPAQAGTYDVSPSAIGNAKILVDNQTKYYVELRKNFDGGELFLILRPYEKGTKAVAAGPVDLFVILKGAVRTSLDNPVPKIVSKVLYDENENPVVYTRQISETSTASFVIDNVNVDLSKMAVENVVVSFLNRASNGGRLLTSNPSGDLVYLASGGGREIVNPGKTDAYYFKRANPKSSTVDIAAYAFKVGTTYYTMPSTAQLKVGYEYTIKTPLTGTVCEVVEDGPIDLADYEAGN